MGMAQNHYFWNHGLYMGIILPGLLGLYYLVYTTWFILPGLLGLIAIGDFTTWFTGDYDKP